MLLFVKTLKVTLKNTSFFKKYNELIFEEYKGGQEIQVAVINGMHWSNRTNTKKIFFMIIKLNIPKSKNETYYASKITQK